MTKLADLRNELRMAQERASQLMDSSDLKAIQNALDEINTIKGKIAILEAQEAPKPVELPEKEPQEVSIVDAFAHAVVGSANPEELQAVQNLLVEETGSKGGYTVPEDVQTTINELKRKKFDIRQYINTESTSTLKGSRVIEANEPNATGFASTDEGAEIQALHEPELGTLEYIVRKYAGFIPVTNELLEDSAENIAAWIAKWMAKNELNTYNYQVFNGTGTKSSQGIMTEATKSSGLLKNMVERVKAAPDIKLFKRVYNVDLDELDSDSIKLFTTSVGYDYIDNLKDGTGKYYLQEDVTMTSGYRFLGHEIVKVPSKFLTEVTESDITYVPFIIGDLQLLYTLFDRKQMSIETTTIGGEAWRKDKTEIKGIFRFDGRLVDTGAVKILLVDKTKLQ